MREAETHVPKIESEEQARRAFVEWRAIEPEEVFGPDEANHTSTANHDPFNKNSVMQFPVKKSVQVDPVFD